MEKQPVVSTTQLSDGSQDPRSETNRDNISKWRPGYFRRFPAWGIGSLIGVIICAFAAAGVLVGSDGKSSVYWPSRYAPNVVLSAINSIANFLLATAIAEGVAITWWRHAMHGATVEELHRSWSFTKSTSALAKNFLHLDKIAMTAIAMKLTIADGILLQRATSAYIAQDQPRQVTVNAVAATQFPTTGYVVGIDNSVAQTGDSYMIADTYTPVVNTWETSNGFFEGYNNLFTPCNGVCYSRIEAIGFEIDCQQSNQHTDLAINAIKAWNANHGPDANASQWTNVPIFNNSFNFWYSDSAANYSRMTMNLQYFQSDNPSNPDPSSCPGTYTNIQCQLRPAIINYPIKVTNYSNAHVVNGVGLGEVTDPAMDASSGNGQIVNYIPEYDPKDKQAEGFTVVRYLYPSEVQTVGATTSLGGIANALSQYLGSSATITYTGSDIWALRQQGTLAQTMMYGPPNMGTCDCSFRNSSLNTMVAGINQLMFLTATGLVDRTSYNQTGQGISSGTQARIIGVTSDTDITATWTTLGKTLQIADVTHYRTHYLFMGLGVGSMLICILLVAPTFWAYGQLGRKVTLGPMEIAHAFGSPVLTRNKYGQIVKDDDIDVLMKAVGKRHVKYGFQEEDERQYGATMSMEGYATSSPDTTRNPASPRSPPPMSPMSTVSVVSNPNRRSAVILRVDDPEKVSHAAGRSSKTYSSPTSP